MSPSLSSTSASPCAAWWASFCSLNIYAIYQQIQLKRLRTELAQQIEIAAEQHMRAEEFLKLAMLDPTTVQDRGRRLMPKAFLLSIGA